MSDLRGGRLQGMGEPEDPGRWIAPASIVAASTLTLVPLVATVGIVPPFGLLMLLAWRLRRQDVFPMWAPLPLGLFDDLVSGQPLGSAMLLWTLTVIAIDVLQTRIVWRTFPLDWLIAAGALAFCLIGGRLVATPLSAHVDAALLLQLVAAIALFPPAAAICARLDARRSRR